MTTKLTPDAESRYRKQGYAGQPRIEGFERIELKRFNDSGGSMIELMRFKTQHPSLADVDFAQVNYSVVQPDVVKAFHVHREQTDVWFVPPEDRVLLVVSDVRQGSASEGVTELVVLGDGRSMLVRIPPGVAHGCRNLGAAPARIIYFTDRLFDPDPERCDEGRLPWDFVGQEVWDIPRE